jgi:hypothetical protein
MSSNYLTLSGMRNQRYVSFTFESKEVLIQRVFLIEEFLRSKIMRLQMLIIINK